MTVLPMNEIDAVSLLLAEQAFLHAKRRHEQALQLPAIFPQSQAWFRFTRGEMETAERRLRTLSL
jgi:hypothetical protein